MIAIASIHGLPLVNIDKDGGQSNNTDSSILKANSPNSQSDEVLPTNQPSILFQQNADSGKLYEPAKHATENDEKKSPNRRSTSIMDGMLSSLSTVSGKSEHNGNTKDSSTLKPTVAAVTTTTAAPKMLSKRELADEETNHTPTELPDDGQNNVDANSDNDGDSNEDESQPTIIECDGNDSSPL